MISIHAPVEFLNVCHELKVDPRVLDEIGISIATYALLNVRQSDVVAIANFINKLLEASYSSDEYFDWWATMPVGFHPKDGAGVVEILRGLQQELSIPRVFS